MLNEQQCATCGEGTSSLVPSGNDCHVGTSWTMWSLTESRQSISRRHMAFFSGGSGSSLHSCPKMVAASNARGAHKQSVEVRMTVETAWGGRSGSSLTAEVGDGVGDGERGAYALSAPRHVLAEQQLGEPLLHHLHLCQWDAHALLEWSRVATEIRRAGTRSDHYSPDAALRLCLFCCCLATTAQLPGFLAAAGESSVDAASELEVLPSAESVNAASLRASLSMPLTQS
jgi:hypothetical protein